MQIVDLSTYLCNVSLTLLTFTLGHHNILLPVTECPSWSPNTLLSLLCYACSLLLLSLPESQNRFLSLIFTLSFGSVQKPPFKSLILCCIHQAFLSSLSHSVCFSPFWKMNIDPYQKIFYIIVTISIVFYLIFSGAAEKSPWSSYAIWQASFWQHHLRDVGTAK